MQFTKDQKYKIIKKICPNTTECITFGTQSDQIRELFDEFKIPSKLIDTSDIKQIGEKSNNGVIYRLKYQLKDYNAHTIIKNAISDEADNLYYEAVVGWYINSKMRYYPCFVETYDLYKNNNERDPKTNMIIDFKLHNLKPLFPEPTTTTTISPQSEDSDKMDIETPEEFIIPEVHPPPTASQAAQQPKTLEEVETDFYKKITEAEKLIETCKEADTISLNIQYLENVTSLLERLITDIPIRKMQSFFDICAYLYQVYAPLSMLSNEFTHYDLHGNNVLIYKVAPNKYTKMIYHYPDNTTVEFNTLGVAKIIDYGRCYFKYNDTINSEKFIDILEKSTNHYNRKNPTKRQIGPCGYNSFSQGFQKYFIDSRTRNKSHDLRLLTNVNLVYKHYKNQIMFNVEYKKQYGTPEVSQNRYKKRGDKIYNVDEIHDELRQMLMTQELKKASETLEQIAILHGTIECWLDASRPMTFTPAPVEITDKGQIFRRPIHKTTTELDVKPVPIPKSLQYLIKTPERNEIETQYIQSAPLQKQMESVGGKPIRKTKRNKKNNDKRKTYKTINHKP